MPHKTIKRTKCCASKYNGNEIKKTNRLRHFGSLKVFFTFSWKTSPDHLRDHFTQFFKGLIAVAEHLTILRYNCFLIMHGSKSTRQKALKALEDTLIEFINVIRHFPLKASDKTHFATLMAFFWLCSWFFITLFPSIGIPLTSRRLRSFRNWSWAVGEWAICASSALALRHHRSTVQAKTNQNRYSVAFLKSANHVLILSLYRQKRKKNEKAWTGFSTGLRFYEAKREESILSYAYSWTIRSGNWIQYQGHIRSDLAFAQYLRIHTSWFILKAIIRISSVSINS